MGSKSLVGLRVAKEYGLGLMLCSQCGEDETKELIQINNVIFLT